MADQTNSRPAGGTLRVTWVKSSIGYKQDQKDTIKSLGLRRLNQTIELPDTPSVRGMVFKVKHLVAMEEVG
jgi:large subunit ribosomal protein L30